MIGFDSDFQLMRSEPRMFTALDNHVFKTIGAEHNRTDFALAA